MGKQVKDRDSNIELLRIFLMLGVIILHYNGTAGGFDTVTPGSVNEAALHLLEAVSICAVDTFVIISGYFMCRRETTGFRKPIELVFQVIFWSECIIVSSNLLGMLSGADIKTAAFISPMIRALIPSNWFVILYAVTYLLSPYINTMLRNLDTEHRRAMLITLFAVLSIWACISDTINSLSGDGTFAGFNPLGPGGSQAGYTLVNFIFMYVLGACIRLDDVHWSRKRALLFIVASITILWAWDMLDLRLTSGTSPIVRSYNNPVIIFYSVSLVMLVKDFSIGSKPWINSLARASFTVFLLHTFFLMHIGGAARFSNTNCLIMTLCIIAEAVVIYLICYIAYQVYNATIGSLFRKYWNHRDYRASI